MHYRALGRTGIQVSEIGYGSWGIGQKQWIGATDDGSLRALRRAISMGLNFIDTALAYGEGHSERLVGKVLAEHAAGSIYVASKVPPKNRVWPARPGIGIEEVFPYDHIVDCTDQSLRNLGVAYLDLQQLHVWNPEWSPRDEWKRAVEDLKKAGKIRFFGISINDHQPDSALDAIQTGLIDTVQVIYNIFDQTPEEHLFPLCREKSIGVIARVPFDEGALTGNITEHTEFPAGDFRASYFRGDRKKEVAAHVNALLADLGMDRSVLPQLALRFCLSQPAVSTVIPGMRSLRSVEENCAASGLGPLPERLLPILKKHAWNRNFYM
jgi:aryl-alcohol dehydrogenase-like predicted oxidoreductase